MTKGIIICFYAPSMSHGNFHRKPYGGYGNNVSPGYYGGGGGYGGNNGYYGGGGGYNNGYNGGGYGGVYNNGYNGGGGYDHHHNFNSPPVFVGHSGGHGPSQPHFQPPPNAPGGGFSNGAPPMVHPSMNASAASRPVFGQRGPVAPSRPSGPSMFSGRPSMGFSAGRPSFGARR